MNNCEQRFDLFLCWADHFNVDTTLFQISFVIFLCHWSCWLMLRCSVVAVGEMRFVDRFFFAFVLGKILCEFPVDYIVRQFSFSFIPGLHPKHPKITTSNRTVCSNFVSSCFVQLSINWHASPSFTCQRFPQTIRTPLFAKGTTSVTI